MREYLVSTGNATVVNGTSTLIFLNPAAAPSANIEVLRWWVGQSANATSAQQRIQVERQPTPFPTLTSATPAKLKAIDAVSALVGSTTGAAGTAGVTASSEGTTTNLKAQMMDDAFNVLNGWLHVPTPPETAVTPAGSTSGIGLFFPAAPATLTGWAYGCTFREV